MGRISTTLDNSANMEINNECEVMSVYVPMVGMIPISKNTKNVSKESLNKPA